MRTRRKRPKALRGLTNSTLDNLWSRLVKRRWNGQCAICGANDQALQAHHVVHRNRLALRFDPDNGVAVCSIGSCPLAPNMTCHQYADTLAGQDYIRDLFGTERWGYLQEKQHVLKRDELLADGLSEAQWRKRWKRALEAHLKEDL